MKLSLLVTFFSHSRARATAHLIQIFVPCKKLPHSCSYFALQILGFFAVYSLKVDKKVRRRIKVHSLLQPPKKERHKNVKTSEQASKRQSEHKNVITNIGANRKTSERTLKRQSEQENVIASIRCSIPKNCGERGGTLHSALQFLGKQFYPFYFPQIVWTNFSIPLLQFHYPHPNQPLLFLE